MNETDIIATLRSLNAEHVQQIRKLEEQINDQQEFIRKLQNTLDAVTDVTETTMDATETTIAVPVQDMLTLVRNGKASLSISYNLYPMEGDNNG